MLFIQDFNYIVYRNVQVYKLLYGGLSLPSHNLIRFANMFVLTT